MKSSNIQDYLNYDPDTGNITWSYGRGNGVKKDTIAGYINDSGYRHIKFKGKLYLAHRICWFLYYGKEPDLQIDHINHVRDDNRIVNLREVSNLDNHHNKSKNANNTSGYTGIALQPSGNWRAYITIKGKYKNLGTYKDINDAITARKEEEEFYGFHSNHGS